MALTADLLFASIRPSAQGRRVHDVRMGSGYTAVQLDDGAAGVAFTHRDVFTGQDRETFFHRTREKNHRAEDFLKYLQSPSWMEKAVGLATANALVNRAISDLTTGDILEVLRLEPGDRVGMAGYFAPLLPRLVGKVAEVVVFERAEKQEELGPGVRPAEEAALILPQCQVALLTATALINETMDGLLEACAGCREVVILGASTPLCPRAFASTPVTFLSGIVVVQAAALLEAVGDGGKMPQFRGLVTKVNCRIKS